MAKTTDKETQEFTRLNYAKLIERWSDKLDQFSEFHPATYPRLINGTLDFNDRQLEPIKTLFRQANEDFKSRGQITSENLNILLLEALEHDSKKLADPKNIPFRTLKFFNSLGMGRTSSIGLADKEIKNVDFKDFPYDIYSLSGFKGSFVNCNFAPEGKTIHESWMDGASFSKCTGIDNKKLEDSRLLTVKNSSAINKIAQYIKDEFLSHIHPDKLKKIPVSDITLDVKSFERGIPALTHGPEFLELVRANLKGPDGKSISDVDFKATFSAELFHGKKVIDRDENKGSGDNFIAESILKRIGKKDVLIKVENHFNREIINSANEMANQQFEQKLAARKAPNLKQQEAGNDFVSLVEKLLEHSSVYNGKAKLSDLPELVSHHTDGKINLPDNLKMAFKFRPTDNIIAVAQVLEISKLNKKPEIKETIKMPKEVKDKLSIGGIFALRAIATSDNLSSIKAAKTFLGELQEAGIVKKSDINAIHLGQKEMSVADVVYRKFKDPQTIRKILS